jgi:pyruvate/2-oxoglutarate dehydrogenase complex dihydrolipoamide dehydrogenase (E3) component
MPNDHDLVIIGGSLAGYQAALTATELGAKVALVEPQAHYEINYHHVLRAVGKITNYSRGANIGLGYSQLAAKSLLSDHWQETILYARSVATNLIEQHSLANLAAHGVDMIVGSGEFQSSPQLGFQVNQRLLQGRTYLLACGSRPAMPEIDGLEKTGYLTLEDIWPYLSQKHPPGNLVILGGVPQSLEIAQTLAYFGYKITLICHKTHLFKYLEPEISQLLIAQLEADGVTVFNDIEVTQVRQIGDKKWLQAGDRAIETEEIIVATGQQPNFSSLNLSPVGVKYNSQRIFVNERLQTTNQRIYACGDIIGGYSLTNIANHEAYTAIHNALFLPQTKINYQCLPWVISTQPMAAKVGLTAAQAHQRYAKSRIFTCKQYYKSLTTAQMQNEITGICKLVALENGEILGCSIFGAEAGELINIIALAMSRQVKVNDLVNLAPTYPGFGEILFQTAREWQKQKLDQNHLLQELIQSFLHFRRDWNW